MDACIVEDVKQDAARAVRNLPDAHAPWQAFWRNARFRGAIGRIDAALYSLKVEPLKEQHVEVLQDLADVVIKVIEIHVSQLGSGVRDEVDRQFFHRAIQRLRNAAEALAEGQSPNPENRPSEEERLEKFAAGVRRAKLA